MSSVNKNDFPFIDVIFKSGSVVFKKLKLKFRRPENPESTINKAKVPTTTPTPAIMVMIFMVLLELLENKYLLAM